MLTAKPTLSFKYDIYDIQVEVTGQRKLGLTVLDAVSRSQFFEKELNLVNIGSNTLIKALQRAKKQISITFYQKHYAENHLLEMKVSVESPFLKPVEQIILLKKVRQVGEAQIVKKAMDHLSRKIKNLKEQNEGKKIATYYGGLQQQKHYTNASTYENIASIKLPKGKYLLTFNFLAKCQNQWMYLYFGQGQSLMTNCGFYVPSTGQFIAHTVRKIHTVTNQTENVSFTTYCASSYPVTIRNAIITAKPMSE